jgi:hypothetical protein
MSERDYHLTEHRTHNVKRVSGKFFPNGTSAPTASLVRGVGASVARSGVGTFVVTLDDYYDEVLACGASVVGTPAGSGARVSAVTPGTRLDAPATVTVVYEAYTPGTGGTGGAGGAGGAGGEAGEPGEDGAAGEAGEPGEDGGFAAADVAFDAAKFITFWVEFIDGAQG